MRKAYKAHTVTSWKFLLFLSFVSNSIAGIFSSNFKCHSRSCSKLYWMVSNIEGDLVWQQWEQMLHFFFMVTLYIIIMMCIVCTYICLDICVVVSNSRTQNLLLDAATTLYNIDKSLWETFQRIKKCSTFACNESYVAFALTSF